MKVKTSVAMVIMTLALAALGTAWNSNSQQATNLNYAQSFHWASPLWGPQTNGYRAGLAVTWAHDHFAVDILIRRSTNVSDSLHPTNMNEFVNFGPRFLVATNGWTGPMILKGSGDAELSPLKPELMFSNAYPETLSWGALMHEWADNKQSNKRIPGYRAARFGAEERDEQAKHGFFNLNRYFKFEKPGDYVLTVWPKIYEKVQKGEDTFHRIDIPPVSFKFRWDGTAPSETSP
jgi:hypothetical protein